MNVLVAQVATVTNGQLYSGPVDQVDLYVTLVSAADVCSRQALFDEATLEAQLDRTPGVMTLRHLWTESAPELIGWFWQG